MSNKIILISGKMGSGKDTVARMLQKKLEAAGWKVYQKKYAQYLKEMCATSFKPLIEDLNREFLEHDLGFFVTKEENWYENKNFITRRILQIVGTDLFRNHVDKNFWTNHLALEITHDINHSPSVDNIFIISDWRFRSEMELIDMVNKYYGLVSKFDVESVLINVKRKLDHDNTGKHSSENDLNDFTGFDFVIDNSGTIEDLELIIDNLTKNHF